jgi:hypothetical protein
MYLNGGIGLIWSERRKYTVKIFDFENHLKK